MITNQLYLLDSELACCSARVLACQKTSDGRFKVLLDKSPFFPEKGGQGCDLGTIGEALVVHCAEEDGEQWHYCTAELAVGSEAMAKIDWGRRFDFMQQHTGEHNLSFFAHKLFGAVNCGFHCAVDYATLDLDIPLNAEQLELLENECNAFIAKDSKIKTTIYDDEHELLGIELRKHTEGLFAPIRVVAIENGDSCTCCAPHVKNNAQVGMVKITEHMAYKGGMRLTFLCGSRALKHTQALQEELRAIAMAFSTGIFNASAAVTKQAEELLSIKRELKQTYDHLYLLMGQALCAKAEPINKTLVLIERIELNDAKRLRPLALQTLKTDRALTILFAVNAEQLSYVLCCKGIKHDMGELCKTVNVMTGGKGGGRGELAQGSAKGAADVEQYIDALRKYVSSLLKG